MGLALVFEATIGSRTIEGVDFLRLDALGLVNDFRVMVRPHSALEALMEAMVPAIERVLAEQDVAEPSLLDGHARPRASRASAASVVSGATPAHSSVSTGVAKPSAAASRAVARTQ